MPIGSGNECFECDTSRGFKKTPIFDGSNTPVCECDSDHIKEPIGDSPL